MRYDISGGFLAPVSSFFSFFRVAEHVLYRVDHLIPPDSRVEIDAKIAAGYFSSGKQVTEADLVKTVGRT